MTLTWIWTGMVLISFIFSILTGNINTLSDALTNGAKSAVTLCIDLCGITCIWCGVMKILERSGFLTKTAKALSPLISKLLPDTKKKPAAAEYAAANITANILGLGNAATPLGLKTIAELHDGSKTASDDICTFTVLNTASIQLIPITVASIRMAAGAQNAFDILPAVWITSIASAFIGISATKLLSKLS